jgi:hypothetical protein
VVSSEIVDKEVFSSMLSLEGLGTSIVSSGLFGIS